MQNKVTSTLKDDTLVTIESLKLGQLFYWVSSHGKMIGIRALLGGTAYGILLDEGTYLTGYTEVVAVPAGTTVQIVAG